MTDEEKLKLLVKAIGMYSDFLSYCKSRTPPDTCVGCPFHTTKICDVIGPEEFIFLIGMYVMSNNLGAVITRLFEKAP